MKYFQKFISALILIFLIILPRLTQAEPGASIWTNRFDGADNSFDSGRALAVDASGNVYVTGYSYDGSSGNDYTTIAYSNEGTPLWTNFYNGPGNNADEARAIAVGNGNVYVAGHSTGSSLTWDYAILAYSSSGMPLWTNHHNGPANGTDIAYAVAVGTNSGDVYLTGQSGTGSSGDYMTIAYSQDGLPLWTNRYNGPGNAGDGAYAMALGADGTIYVTGFSSGGGSSSDYATIAYSTTGVPIWTNRYAGPLGADIAYAIAVGTNGNIYVTGSSPGSGSSSDYATVAYSGIGLPLWTNRYNGPGNNVDEARTLAVHGDVVYVTGFTASIGSSSDYATIAYSSSGAALWTNRYNGPASTSDQPNAIGVDEHGNVFVTGYSGNSVSADFITIGYSSAGLPLWTNRYDGPASNADQGQAMVIDNTGHVIVTGYSTGNASGWDFATIKYSGAGLSPIPLSIQLTGNQSVLTWANPAFSLQSSPTVQGTYTNILGATSPYTNLISGEQRFFQLRGN